MKFKKMVQPLKNGSYNITHITILSPVICMPNENCKHNHRKTYKNAHSIFIHNNQMHSVEMIKQ